MTTPSVLLLGRALRYRDQAAKARRLARGLSSDIVARNLVDLAHKLERKAVRVERASALIQMQEQPGNGEQAAAAD